MNGIDCIDPPSANHAPNTNNSCQAKGLKYHSPAGYAGRFQPNWRAAKYNRTGGNNSISTIYSGSTSRLTGLNLRIKPSHRVSAELRIKGKILNSSANSGL